MYCGPSAERSPDRAGKPKESRQMPPDSGSASPLAWVVLKIAQRCNLNCTYCYVYNRGDDSWKSRPTFISDRVVRALSARIVEQAAKHSLSHFTVELHGGEPLLLGKRRFERLVQTMTEQCQGVTLRFVMQTNGLLLDEEWLELLERNGITFGLSLDGPPELTSQQRVRHDGRGSTEELLGIIRRLRAGGPRFDRVNTGVLCVIDPEADAAALMRWFMDQGFDSLDFLLPDGNYANLPEGWEGPEPYRRFLIDAFEEWYRLGEDAPKIRTFEVMIRSFMGMPPVLDALGGDLRGLCVVETNGAIGVSDVARICGGRFAEDSIFVFDTPLDQVAAHFGLEELQQPCAECYNDCQFVDNTGGGYLPHRWDGRSFDNPSIYCSALCDLAGRIYRQLREDIPAELWKPKEHVTG